MEQLQDIIFIFVVYRLHAEDQTVSSSVGRLSATEISPPLGSVMHALTLLEEAKRPVIIVGYGAVNHMAKVKTFAEEIGAPVLTTFKAKGLIADDHPLAAGVLGRCEICGAGLCSWPSSAMSPISYLTLCTGLCMAVNRSGTPVASWAMSESDLLIVFGATFSAHTGINSAKRTIQVDHDRMALGKFHPVDAPIWGDIGVTANTLAAQIKERSCASVSPL